ncbi:Uncharacterised protein [Actinobacillus equuli]|nr:Uncharacterised protein [Actinobacillus equuli]
MTHLLLRLKWNARGLFRAANLWDAAKEKSMNLTQKNWCKHRANTARTGLAKRRKTMIDTLEQLKCKFTKP